MKKFRVILLAFGIVAVLFFTKYVFDINLDVKAMRKDLKTIPKQGENYLVEPQFSNCSDIFISGLLRYEKTDENGRTYYGYVDENGRIIADAIFEDTLESVYFSSAVNPLYDVQKTTLIPVKKDGKWGYIDRNGNIIISFKYDKANIFREGKACVKLNSKWGYINEKGENIIPFSYDEAYNFINGVSCVLSNEKYGFIDANGNWIVDPEYNYLTSAILGYTFDNTNTIIFYKGNHQGLLKMEDGSVKILAKPIYNKIFPFSNGEALYTIQEKDSQGNDIGKSQNGYLDENGSVHISWLGGQDIYGLLSEGLRAVYDSTGKWGYVDKNNKVVIPYIYDKAENFRNGMAVVGINNKYGIIDNMNNNLLDIVYDSISLPYNNYIVAEKNNSQQLIDPKTFKSVGKIYNKILYQDNNFLIIQNDNKFGLMNDKGVEVVPPLYDSVDQLNSFFRKDIDSNGFWLKQNNKWIYMDFNGNRRFDKSFDDVDSFRFGYAAVKINDNWGLVDREGNEILDYKYDKISIISSYEPDSMKNKFAKMVAVQLHNKFGLISLQ